MAYDARYCRSTSVGVAARPGSSKTLRDWRYMTADSLAVVMAPGYFPADGGFSVGDTILVSCSISATAEALQLVVTAISPVTVSTAADTVAQGLAEGAAAAAIFGAARDIAIPSGLGFDADYLAAATIATDAFGNRVGGYGFDPFASAAYQACRNGTQIYYALTGNDTTGNGSSGNPYRTGNKCIQVANAGGQPCTIWSVAGNYLDGRLDTSPTVPIAFVAKGGVTNLNVSRSLTWSRNTSTFPALTGYPHVWAVARSNFGSAVSPRLFDFLGNNQQYVSLPAPITGVSGAADQSLSSILATINATPGTIYSDGTNIYCNPFGGEAASDSTVRVYLTGNLVNFETWSTPKDLFFTGETALDSFDLEGMLRVTCSVAPAQKQLFALRNVTARNSGNPTNNDYNGLSIEGWHGLVFLDRVVVSNSYLDDLNFHNVLGASMSVVAVNCKGRGVRTSGSNQPITFHENIPGIVLGGDFCWGRGGAVRNINTSKVLFAGTSISFDQGGAIPATQVYAGDAAKIWLDGCKIDGLPFGQDIYVESGASVYVKNMRTQQLRIGGPGSVQNYT